MTPEPYLDPLHAAEDLRIFILQSNEEVPTLRDLSDKLDAVVYSLRFLLVDDVKMIPSTDDDPPDFDYQELRALVAKRFPNLGLYWTALYSKLDSERPAEIAVEDAVDDLADILAELHDVRWYSEHHGRAEALAALRWRYEHHLWMHIMPLRGHLAELEYDG